MLTADLTLGALINTGLNIVILGYLINFSRKVAVIETIVNRCQFCNPINVGFCNPTKEEINNDPKS